MREAPEVRAAGCVLWRFAPDGDNLQLALVYRPKWADWSFPKGKLKRGETWQEAAVREVREETGMLCELGPALPSAYYLDARKRTKEVRYWAARATTGTFTPNSEVSHMAWLSPTAASDRLTHERDRSLVPAFLAALGQAGRVGGTGRRS
ncbi:NUDIX hydrolase [Streptomyces mesophilus]|uniref:NUDIX hydrolase n=1 Tax=Streptomyces mesophilus TaxID=1775132 RepID=UPI003320235D